MPYIDFAELRTRVTLEQGAQMLGLALTPHGEQFRAACPRCNSGGPKAIVLTPSKGLFNCFPGKKGGDVTALVSHVLGCTMPEAAAKLDAFFENRTVQSTVNSTVSKNHAKEPVKGFDFEAYADKLDTEHDGLPVSSETLKHFRSGYSKAGQNVGRLAIAVHDTEGSIIAFCGRALRENDSPTLKLPNGINPEGLIFNAHRVKEGEIYLVRDPLDVLIAYEGGIENCVCLLTETISAMQLQMLASLMDQKNASRLEMY